VPLPILTVLIAGLIFYSCKISDASFMPVNFVFVRPFVTRHKKFMIF